MGREGFTPKPQAVIEVCRLEVCATRSIATTMRFYFEFALQLPNFLCVTVDTFKHEIADAVKAYDKFVVCIDKTPEECEASLRSLMEKAIKAYENRGAHLRHGIALDRQVTIILSQTENDRPLCGIYFNLHSPYQKDALPKTVKEVKEKED